MYTVAFANGSLPANVDQLVAAAGGTIVVRLPEIGGIGVTSVEPDLRDHDVGERRRSRLPDVGGERGSPSESSRGVRASAAASAAHARRSAFARPASRWRGQRRGGGRRSAAGAGRSRLAAVGQDAHERLAQPARTRSTAAGRTCASRSPTRASTQTHPDIQAEPRRRATARRSSPTPRSPRRTSRRSPHEPTIQDFNGHGTWTASAVAAPINRVGISGVAPNVSIVELKTQDANGNGLLLWFDQAMRLRGREAPRHRLVEHRRVRAEVRAAIAREQTATARTTRWRIARSSTRATTVSLVVAAMGNDNLDSRRSANDLDEYVFGVSGRRRGAGRPAAASSACRRPATSTTRRIYSNYGHRRRRRRGARAATRDFQTPPRRHRTAAAARARRLVEHRAASTLRHASLRDDCDRGTAPLRWPAGHVDGDAERRRASPR